MLTISGMHKGETKLTIPNQVVREQLFAYILDTYHENDLTFDSYEKRKLVSGLAYDGKWKPYFEYIAGCLHRYASQQDKQKGEYFVHGFTLAITAQNPFYRPVSEKDSQEGYVNLFLHPLLDIYKDMSHSYIIELKYAKGKDSSERIEQLRRQAIEQAERYASSESVQKAISPTMLHKIIVVYRGMEMYNPQIQISAESETKRSIFREKDKTKRSKKESAQHSKSRNKSFVMTSVSAL